MVRTIITFCFMLFFIITVPAQRIGKLGLYKGQVILVNVEMTNNSFQTAGAQVINFRLNGKAVHQFTVTGTTADRYTLHYEMQQLGFSFEGMGQKKSFDSKNTEDVAGPYGTYFNKILLKKYDIIIDTNGKTISFTADTSSLSKPDEKLATIADMLKPLLREVEPTTLGPGFFYLLPGDQGLIKMPWSKGMETKTENIAQLFKLDSVTDSTILVDLEIKGNCNFSTESMGRVAKTNQIISGTGKIVVDRHTGLLKEKNVTTSSNGTTEAMGGTVPINGKVNLAVTVSLK